VGISISEYDIFREELESKTVQDQAKKGKNI